ncbi:MAG: 6-carboxytetrahydropterin synthase [Marinobacterium sp.]|nr:6-carboxytetrahydropterin synthase [Marinobacterium sp.]
MKLFVDNLTNVDFSYLHPQRGLLGESWLVQLELDGSLNSQGMICDFAIVKKVVKDWFDSTIDHSLVVPMAMPGLQVERDQGYTSVSWQALQGDGSCYSPDQAITLTDLHEITEQGLALWCRQQLQALFPPEYVQGLRLSFRAEPTTGPFYHYSHGLQQHDGNCQRIAHGHRSKIEILIDDERHSELEQQWAKTLRDSYIATRAHLVEQTDEAHSYAYQAPQGRFELVLPADACYLMDTETTVELIACHLADVIKQDFPQQKVTVRAFEGVGKGAIAER